MGRVRITRPFVLLALAALLAPRIEASRTSVWESNPPAAVLTTTNAAGLLAPLAPAADTDVEITEAPLVDLGDVVLVERADADAEHFNLGPLTLVDLNLLRGPPPSYVETRVGGFELLPPFRVGASPTLSLWGRQTCGSFSCGLASDSRYDPWGLCAFGLPCPKAAQAAIDWAGVAVDTTISNLSSAGNVAAGMAAGAVDVATAGVSAGFRSASATAATAKGSTSERMSAVGRAFVRGQVAALTHGFSDAEDKVAHAKELVGAGAIDRGTRRGFEGALAGDFDEAVRGGAEALGGVGQLSGTAAAVYAPFAAGPVANPPEQLLTKNGRYEALSEAPISGTSRSAHRAAANRNFLQTLEDAPSFAEYLSRELGRDVISHMKSGRSGLRNPPGTEWHHPLENPDVMYLLRRQVHRNPELQGILNDAEGSGGYARHYGNGGR